ncbi:hypothetical protein CPB86DRAFT_802084 [Serendipita vermifera]|nr:hypothetical protein CPB86DRAFT_802084 [Serendipita vermifera]
MLADSWIRLRHHATLVFCRSSPKYTLQHYAICCLGSVGQTVIVGSSSSGPFGGKPGLESNAREAKEAVSLILLHSPVITTKIDEKIARFPSMGRMRADPVLSNPPIEERGYITSPTTNISHKISWSQILDSPIVSRFSGRSL